MATHSNTARFLQWNTYGYDIYDIRMCNYVKYLVVR